MLNRVTTKVELRYIGSTVSKLSRCFSTNLKIRFNLKDGEQNQNLEVIRKLEQNYLCGLPHDLDGTHSVPKLQSRELVDTFLTHKQINDEFLTDKFHNMVQNFYSAVALNQQDHIETLAENRFAKKIKIVQDQNSKKNLKLDFKPHEVPHVERAEEDQSYIFDKMFEKGVYFDREQNDNNYDYFLDNQCEMDGIRYFQHKYFAGYDRHYYLDRYADKQEEDDRLAPYRFKYILEKRNRSIVFRIY